jgi:uncharacterized protein (DUF1800 family)
MPDCRRSIPPRRPTILPALARTIGTVVLAAGVGLGASVAAAAAPAATDSAAVYRAASRLGYWPAPQTVAAIAAHPGGARGWALEAVDRALAASRQPPPLTDAFPTLQRSVPELFAAARAEREARQQAARALPPGSDMNAAALPPVARANAQEAAAWRMRACADPAFEDPLLARLTEFWFNHLNVSVGKGGSRPFVGHYALHAIRPHVLGRYETLLLASARHPAMLFYLDQVQNVATGARGPGGVSRGPNENYARELLELHTLGVAGGYEQRDVRELARVLTGWTVDPEGATGFRFVLARHDHGVKQVLGLTLSGAGEAEGQRVIALLAQHPATARRIAERLARTFVADDPPPSVIDRLAAEYRAGAGDLRRVMRALVDSAEFWDPSNTLFKTPIDYACSALGATLQAAEPPQAGPRGRTGAALGFLFGAGQPMNAWQTPDGYRTDAATWMAPEAITRRADLAATLTAGGTGAIALEQLLPFLSAPTRDRVLRGPTALQPALALASPDFMRK